MPTALSLYSLLFITWKGKLLTETGSIQLDRNLNASDVTTLAKGWSGVSPGAGVTDIRVTNAVPAADFEQDGGKNMSTYEPVEIGVLGPGGKQLTVDCFMLSDSISASVNNPTQLDFTLRGPFAEWK